MEVITLAKSITELGVLVVIAGVFIYLVLRMQKQDEISDIKLEQSRKDLKEQGDNFLQMMKESQDKYFESMQQVTKKFSVFEYKLDDVNNKIVELHKKVSRGEK